MEPVEYTVWEKCPLTNPMLRMHWAKAAELKKQWALLILREYRANPFVADVPVVVEFQQVIKGKRLPDIDSCSVIGKACIDALTGLAWVDDNPRWVAGVMFKQHEAGERYGLRMTIRAA